MTDQPKDQKQEQQDQPLDPATEAALNWISDPTDDNLKEADDIAANPEPYKE